MNIGIIGLGWLGLPLAKSLVNSGHVVYGTTRNRGIDFRHTNFYYETYDPAIKKHFLSERFYGCDIVVLAFPPDRTAIRTYAKDCVKVIQQFNAKTRFILISSTSVYPQKTGEFNEEDIHPDYLHQTSLGYAEDALGALLEDRLTIIRMAGLIGPNRYPVLFMANSGKPYIGNEPVNVIHQSDAIGIIEFVIAQQLFGKIINGVSSKHPLKKEFYTKMAQALNEKAPTWMDASSLVVVERIIRNDFIKKLGYQFLYDDPMDYPIA